MNVLIIGAAGMVGRKLTERLLSERQLNDRELSRCTLFDVVEPPRIASAGVEVHTIIGDLSSAGVADKLLATHPDVIFHLAAIVSGEAEQDFEKGYRINLDGTRNLLEAIRLSGNCPQLIFTSSIAVFGAPFPEPIPDDYHQTPLTSYGTQKAICELLVSDYSRKGFVHGVALRLPTICVRPGKPNAAASGFFSSIIREPLSGQTAVLPVDDDVLHWHASPRSAVNFLLHAAALSPEQLGRRRALTLPGVAATVGEQIAALARVAGPQVSARIVRKPDPFVQAIVAGWPRRFAPQRALSLGFKVEKNFDEIIRVHIEDELGGVVS
jgi:nucleoside-diphosphate-sugar epimerase